VETRSDLSVVYPGPERAVTSPQFSQLRGLFEAALDRPPSERREWLREACRGDSQLFEGVDLLLAADALAESELTLPPQGIFSATSAASEPVFLSRRIGQYTTLRELGRGGMGVVYLAERADRVFSTPVAIKVLRPETRDTGLHRRFDQEREIVARLDHANIARLLDGGTTEEGLPYAVIEYVDGQPIDVYCDERRMTIADRVALLRTVCAAVQYAHQHLVIHRDLKPSNILVTPAGVVKLLDFGIAKVLDSASDETLGDQTAGLRPLTLRYASPEQITGGRISTSTDVYSLGVILYELLTGRHPYVTEELRPHQLIRAVGEETPPAPSQVARTAAERRHLRGELDTIVMMALRKEPDRRYSSVEKFSEDLRRHLSGLPVLAQADSAMYRTRKFVGRHRTGVAAAAMILISLAGAVAATTWQARIADGERHRAEDQAAQARMQTERAERQTREAERYRLQAEREAEFARTQLRIANERAREAALEREKADRRARSVQAVTSVLLELEARLPDVPGGNEAGRRAADEAQRSLLALRSEGFDANSLGRDTAAASELVKRYEARQASVTVVTPSGWRFESDRPDDYEHGLDRTFSTRGAVAYIKNRTAGAVGLAMLVQDLDVSPYVGKRVRVSALLRSNAIDQFGGLLFRIAHPEGALLGNRRNLAMHGTNEWSRQSVVFDVEGRAVALTIGFALTGPGVIWADGFSVDVVDASVPLTRVFPSAPVDTDFDVPRQ
jgi:protein kinase-like protein